MTQSFVAIENLCSDIPALLSETRTFIDKEMQKSIENTSDCGSELGGVDCRGLQSEIGTQYTELKNLANSLSEVLATILNRQHPVSYYESYVASMLSHCTYTMTD